MGISCTFGMHQPMTLGVTDGLHEFGRCLECACDLMRSGQGWKRLPRRFKLVSEPAGSSQTGPTAQSCGTYGNKVNLHDVEIVGERTYGDQRFALVILDGDHSVRPSSRNNVHESGSASEYLYRQEAISDQAPLAWKARQRSATIDLFDLPSDDDFEWESAYTNRLKD